MNFSPCRLCGDNPKELISYGQGYQCAGGCLPKPAMNRDPLDVKYDKVTLRDLLKHNEHAHRTPAQRAAVSAHWSAELRAKVSASRKLDEAREVSIVLEQDIEDVPW